MCRSHAGSVWVLCRFCAGSMQVPCRFCAGSVQVPCRFRAVLCPACLAALPWRLRALSRSPDPAVPRSKELRILGNPPARDFPAARAQQWPRGALADARTAFCKPGKFPVLTLGLTQWQLQTESNHGAQAAGWSLRKEGRSTRREEGKSKKQFFPSSQKFQVFKIQHFVLKMMLF